MRRGGCITATALILSAAVYVSRGSRAEYPLQPGRIFDVAVSGNEAVFDLPLTKTSDQYLLVVRNRARDVVPRPITLRAEPITRVERVPLRPVELPQPTPIAAAVPAATAAADPQPARDTRSFWLPVTDGAADNPATYREIVANLAVQGDGVRVYVDRDERPDARTVEAIVDLLARSVRPRAARYLGAPVDVDGDGAFTVVLTPWLERLRGGLLSLGGMVRPSDFSSDRRLPFSNRADVLYLNAHVRPGRHLETLLAHEYAHAITCSRVCREDTFWSAPPAEEAWLNEAISHVSENLQSDNWSNLDYRVAHYLSAPGDAPLVVPSYHAVGLSRDPGTRGGTFLFLRWCTQRYGTELLGHLIHSRQSGVDNLEAATGVPFDELHRQFAIELFLDAARVCDDRSERVDGTQLPELDLADQVGRWDLAGPRCESWDLTPAQPAPIELSLVGTSARHIVVSGTAGPRRIRVTADDGAPIDVSLVRLPADMARLTIDVVPHAEGGWRIELREHCGHAVRIAHMSWETQAPERMSRGVSPHRRLTPEECSELFDDEWIPAAGRVVSRPVRFATMPPEPLTVRLVGIDPAGHRVAAWTTVDLGDAAARLALQPDSAPAALAADGDGRYAN